MTLPELEWSKEERSLLNSASSDAPRPDAKKATLAALGIGGAALGGTAAVTASAKAAELAAAGTKVALGKWLAVVVIAGAAGGVAVQRSGVLSSSPAPAVKATPAPHPNAAVPARSAAELAEIAPAPAPEPVATVKPGAAPSSPAEPDIVAEIAALDRARQAADRGDFAAALAELDRYDRGFKQGGLRQEALLLRVRSLIGAGDRAQAEALGKRFLARYPKSPLAPRMRKLIGAD